jgi:hypothetical protein
MADQLLPITAFFVGAAALLLVVRRVFNLPTNAEMAPLREWLRTRDPDALIRLLQRLPRASDETKADLRSRAPGDPGAARTLRRLLQRDTRTRDLALQMLRREAEDHPELQASVPELEREIAQLQVEAGWCEQFLR